MQMENQVNQNDQSSCGDKKVEIESSSVEVEENAVKFLDSMDNYLILMNSLSSTLRQGWLELASARHSMGTSRVTSALFDLKDHNAATTLQVSVEEPVFKLHKWATFESDDDSKSVSGKPISDDDKLLPSQSNGSPIHHNSSSEIYDVREQKGENNDSPIVAHNQVQKQRMKTLSMFGALFPPKLQAAQLSFETALETLTEIANARASILAGHELVCKEMESTSR